MQGTGCAWALPRGRPSSCMPPPKAGMYQMPPGWESGDMTTTSLLSQLLRSKVKCYVLSAGVTTMLVIFSSLPPLSEGDVTCGRCPNCLPPIHPPTPHPSITHHSTHPHIHLLPIIHPSTHSSSILPPIHPPLCRAQAGPWPPSSEHGRWAGANRPGGWPAGSSLYVSTDFWKA